MSADKPIPKSLHTVRVVAIMAQLLKPANPSASNEELINLALSWLGYLDEPDTHGIRAASLKAMLAWLRS